MTVKQLLTKLKNYNDKATVKIIIGEDNNFFVRDIKLVNINGSKVYIYTQEEDVEWTKKQLN